MRNVAKNRIANLCLSALAVTAWAGLLAGQDDGTIGPENNPVFEPALKNDNGRRLRWQDLWVVRPKMPKDPAASRRKREEARKIETEIVDALHETWKFDKKHGFHNPFPFSGDDQVKNLEKEIARIDRERLAIEGKKSLYEKRIGTITNQIANSRKDLDETGEILAEIVEVERKELESSKEPVSRRRYLDARLALSKHKDSLEAELRAPLGELRTRLEEQMLELEIVVAKREELTGRMIDVKRTFDERRKISEKPMVLMRQLRDLLGDDWVDDIQDRLIMAGYSDMRNDPKRVKEYERKQELRDAYMRALEDEAARRIEAVKGPAAAKPAN